MGPTKVKNSLSIGLYIFENIPTPVMNQRLILGPTTVFSIVKITNGSDLHSWAHNLEKIKKHDPIQMSNLATICRVKWERDQLALSIIEQIPSFVWFWIVHLPNIGFPSLGRKP